VVSPPLSEAELARRARRIRWVLSDVDGTLTDGGVYVSAEGESLKRFDLRDGMGVERLREVGVETAFITRENSPIVTRRGEKLKLKALYQGLRDKAGELPRIQRVLGVELGELAYVGDDVNDLEIIRAIAEQGLTGAPSDAFGPVMESVHFVARRPGGHGAFREFAEWLRGLRERPQAVANMNCHSGHTYPRQRLEEWTWIFRHRTTPHAPKTTLTRATRVGLAFST
jgi:3-deoxy-D-manno-octulosonate 8-phosphate phosphatase (KDO 8-P phosphatase)